MTINQKVAGAAALTSSATAFSASVPGAGQTFTVASATGYPATGRFTVVLDLGTASEEKILCSSRSGTTFTVETRGYDDTTAQSHTNPTVALKLPATIITALIEHVDGDELAPHSTTLPVGTTAGHDTTTRHVLGTAIAVGTPGVIAPDDTASAGAASSVARSDHRHAITTAAAVSVSTANSEGSAATFARSDHVHDIANGAIDAAALFGSGVVDAAAIATGAVGSAELAADAVTAGKIADGGVSGTAELADAIITLAKFASEASQSDSPGSFCAAGTFSLGTGGTSYRHWFKLGRIVVAWIGFSMAADGNLVGTLTIPLPVAMRTAGADGQRGFAAARAQGGAANVFSGTGVVTSGASQVNNIFMAGAGAEWDTTTPFNWGTGGVGACQLDAVVIYEAAT